MANNKVWKLQKRYANVNYSLIPETRFAESLLCTQGSEFGKE